VCAVVVEHGGGGSSVAGPLVRDILYEVQRRDPGRRIPQPGPVAEQNKNGSPATPVNGSG